MERKVNQKELDTKVEPGQFVMLVHNRANSMKSGCVWEQAKALYRLLTCWAVMSVYSKWASLKKHTYSKLFLRGSQFNRVLRSFIGTNGVPTSTFIFRRTYCFSFDCFIVLAWKCFFPPHKSSLYDFVSRLEMELQDCRHVYWLKYRFACCYHTLIKMSNLYYLVGVLFVYYVNVIKLIKY